MLDRGTEDGQRRVALEFVDEAAVAIDGVDYNTEELVEQADDLGRGDGRRELRRPHEVDEKHCDVALLATELGAALKGAAGHVPTAIAAGQIPQPFPFAEIPPPTLPSALPQTPSTA